MSTDSNDSFIYRQKLYSGDYNIGNDTGSMEEGSRPGSAGKVQRMQKLEEIFNIIKDLQDILELDRDEHDIYGEHVATQLRKFSDKKSIAVIRHKIDDVLFRAVMGEFNWQEKKTE